MKIRTEDVQEEEKSLSFREPVDELNHELAAGTADFRFVEPPSIDLNYYRAGDDLLFLGQIRSSVTGTCARCLDAFPLELDCALSLVFKPASDEEGEGLEYGRDDIDLSPHVREELLLALPTRAVCREACAGLCPRCGTNRNLNPCECREDWVDPRFEVLRSLKLPR